MEETLYCPVVKERHKNGWTKKITLNFASLLLGRYRKSGMLGGSVFFSPCFLEPMAFCSQIWNT
jgi:hypothetical protein